MSTLTYAERQEKYRKERLAILTTNYKGWEIIKRRTVINAVNSGIQVMEYIIKSGEHQEATYSMETAKGLIDRYEPDYKE